MSFNDADAAGQTLEAALLRSIIAAGKGIGSLDEGIVEAARAYARAIDSTEGARQVCRSCGEEAVPAPGEKTKALYLGPHYVNALRELGLTPAARQQSTPADGAEVDPQDEAFNDLDRRRAAHRGRRSS